ncbi:PIN domain-containing protein [Puerhibacterium puerhi]|uniref:PIN domain-containing protein n=1 Tax=Puerhibacterium puerhi TaxID=2692623 RepID=UPI0013590795|nr:PIN domain-containing protein [Puerhibacterium puerhi]
MDTEERLAVFIDYENLALGAREHLGGMQFDFKPIADALAVRGRVVVRRAYADWSYFDEDRRALTRHQVELIEMPQRMGASRKNAADIKMVVDTIEMAFERDYISTFVMCTGDSDFSPLVHKLRELNKRVIGVGVEKSTSRLLPPACDEFLFYDRLEGVDVPDADEAPRPARAASAGNRRRRPAKAESPAAEPAAEPAAAPAAEQPAEEAPSGRRRGGRGRTKAEAAPEEATTSRRGRAAAAVTEAIGEAAPAPAGTAAPSAEPEPAVEPAPEPTAAATPTAGAEPAVGTLDELASVQEGAEEPTEEHAEDGEEVPMEVQVARTLADLQASTSGAVTASMLKRTLLRRDPTFSEADYGFRTFGEFVRFLADRGFLELAPGPANGDPEVSLPEQGDTDQAFRLVRSVVEEAGGPVALSGLKNRLRKRRPDFSEKALGYRGFLQFCKAAAASGAVALEWDDDAEDYLVAAG